MGKIHGSEVPHPLNNTRHFSVKTIAMFSTSLSKKYFGPEFKHNKHLGFYHLPDAGLFSILITSLLSPENKSNGSATAL